jgi:uncharacterized membrane protein YedE/YeeE
MTLEAGLLLFLLGMILTIVGLFLAYYYGDKPKDKKEYPPALRELYGKKYHNGNNKDEV